MRYGSMLLAVLCAVAGCGGDDADEPSRPRSNGRGSDACRSWHDAYCDYMVACGDIERAVCEEDIQGITCNGDPYATRCANAFNDATCITSNGFDLSTCDALVVADPEPAQVACNDLLDALCDHLVTCGTFASQGECLDVQRTALDCDKAIGHALRYDTCVSDIEALVCPEDALPASCAGVIKLTL